MQSCPLIHSLIGSQLSGQGKGIVGLQSLAPQKNIKAKNNRTAASRIFRMIFLIIFTNFFNVTFFINIFKRQYNDALLIQVILSVHPKALDSQPVS